MLRIEKTPGARIAYLTDSKIIEESRIKRIGNELADTVKSCPAGTELVLDLGGVEFMTSAMIGPTHPAA